MDDEQVKGEQVSGDEPVMRDHAASEPGTDVQDGDTDLGVGSAATAAGAMGGQAMSGLAGGAAFGAAVAAESADTVDEADTTEGDRG